MTVPVEFQAVVLAAGKGCRMTELTIGKPKCLLPVGNKPLVWYPLFKLQQTGFSEVILVIQEDHKSQIEEALDKTDLDLKIDYFTVPDDEDMGTADSLRLLHEKIITDVIVVSCDLITNASLAGIINMFRMNDASTVSLIFPPQKLDVSQIPGPKTKHKIERDLIGIDSQTNRLVFQASVSDFEESVKLHQALLRKHPKLKMYSTLMDAHLYILKKWVVKYLAIAENMSSIKGELIPHIVRKQLVKQKVPPQVTGSVVTPADTNDIFSLAREDPLTLNIRSMSSYNDHSGDLLPVYHDNRIRCYAYVVASPKDFAVRVNTLVSYWNINKQIHEKWESIAKGQELVYQNPDAEIKSTQVDDKCIIWDGCKLHEKTSFKDSIIGNKSEVHSFSRVFGSILMNNVTIKEKVAIENCIICDGAVIEKGSHLKNCIVGSQHIVPEQSRHTNEILTESDRFMEL